MHAHDLRVLVLASRGPPIRWRSARRAWAHGLDREDRPGVSGQDAAPPGRRDRGAGRRGGGVRGTRGRPGHAAQPGRSAAGPADGHGRCCLVGAAPRRGRAAARTAAAEEARPGLHAALYGRVVATLRAWTGRPDLRVALTMIGESERPALARDRDGIAAELPFGWISEVWARGLGDLLGSVRPGRSAGGGRLGAVRRGPDLGPPAWITITGPHPANTPTIPPTDPSDPRSPPRPGIPP